MGRLVSLLIGYALGNFLTAAVVAKKVSGESIFTQGSKNPGMANVGHLYGAASAVWVLAGDLGKTFLACLVCRFLLFPGLGAIAAAYAGLGVVLGHNFPVWHRFRGGKGVAATCAAIISIAFWFGILACIIGLIGMLISRYLAVGAVIIPLAFIIPAFVFCGVEAGVIAVLLALLMFIRHFPSLKNIPTGTEPKTDLLARFKKRDK